MDVEFQLVHKQIPDMGNRRETLFLLDANVAAGMSRCPPRTIVVFADRVCPLSVLRLVAAGHVIPLRYEGLDQEKMCRAIISCVATNGVGGLVAHLNSHDGFAGVPRRIPSAFVLHPERPTGLADLCQVLEVSPASGRAVVQRAGFRRAEHLYSALRYESWHWFARHGFERSVFEDYLGITDRSHFRRACQRAGLPAPWNADGDDVAV